MLGMLGSRKLQLPTPRFSKQLSKFNLIEQKMAGIPVYHPTSRDLGERGAIVK
jgi:hypothetical protein